MNQEHFDACVRFGKGLLWARDLDPVYVAINNAKSKLLDQASKMRLFLAYTCLYNLAVAGWMSEFTGEAFWVNLQKAAVNKDLAFPRGSERRHWRGANADRSFDSLYQFSLPADFKLKSTRLRRITPEDIVEYWLGARTDERVTFGSVSERVQRFAGFGPWIAFKIADMGERVLGYPVDFSDCSMGVYRDPRQGAALLLTGNKETPISDTDVNGVIKALLKSQLGKLMTDTGDRKLNVQEIETILCKYKSHVNGHYPIGKDTNEVIHALGDARFKCVTNRLLAEGLVPV